MNVVIDTVIVVVILLLLPSINTQSGTDYLPKLLTSERNAHQCWNAIIEKSQTRADMDTWTDEGWNDGEGRSGGKGRSDGVGRSDGGGTRNTEVVIKKHEYKFLKTLDADAFSSCLQSVDKSFIPIVEWRQGKYVLTARSSNVDKPELEKRELESCFPPLMSFYKQLNNTLVTIHGVSPHEIDKDSAIEKRCRELKVGIFVPTYSLKHILVLEKPKTMSLNDVAEMCKKDLFVSLLQIDVGGKKYFEKREEIDQEDCPPTHERIRVKMFIPLGQDESTVQSKFLSHSKTLPFIFKEPRPFTSTKVQLTSLKSNTASLNMVK